MVEGAFHPTASACPTTPNLSAQPETPATILTVGRLSQSIFLQKSEKLLSGDPAVRTSRCRNPRDASGQLPSPESKPGDDPLGFAVWNDQIKRRL
jgi:hypothetical protein